MRELNELSTEVAEALGIQASKVDAVDLLLIRASLELSHLAGNDRARVNAVLYDWIRAIDSTASPELVDTLASRFSEPDPHWLSIVSGQNQHAENHPGFRILLALLQIVPRSKAEARSSWAYVDKAARLLSQDASVLASIDGWLGRSADEDILEIVNKMLVPLPKISPLTSAVVETARGLVDCCDTTGPFRELRERALDSLGKSEGPLAEMNVNRTAQINLRRYLECDHFRLAVLGEFKRGKSTLINALVGVPGLMPTKLLPCTSGLTEIRADGHRHYEVNRRGALGSFEPSNEERFRHEISDADKRWSGKNQPEDEADHVAHWRVSVESEFLKLGSISIIDTPGLGEDYARDRIARTEAERADAAIIVFDIAQQATLEELSLIELLKPKAADVIIVINKAEEQTEEECEKVRQHVLQRISDRTDGISKDRIVFMSALKAEEALRNGGVPSMWIERLKSLRYLIADHLIKRAGSIKMGVLREKVNKFIADTDAAITGQVAMQSRLLADINQLALAKRESALAYSEAQVSVKKATATLKNGSIAAKHLWNGFSQALPQILAAAEQQKETWTSASNPLTSPKKHIQEVGGKAKDSVLAAVEHWMKEKGGAIVFQEFEHNLKKIDDDLEKFRYFLKQSPVVDIDKIIEELKEEITRSGLVTPGDPDGYGVMMRAMVGGALSVVIGYIIADIILFYVMHVITGFLNPFLLAAAIVAGVGVFLFKGEKFVKQWIQGKVADQIREKIQEEKSLKELKQKMTNAIDGIFERIGETFSQKAKELLDETRYQQKRSEDRLEERFKELGHSEEFIRSEKTRIDNAATKARAALEPLREILAS